MRVPKPAGCRFGFLSIMTLALFIGSGLPGCPEDGPGSNSPEPDGQVDGETPDSGEEPDVDVPPICGNGATEAGEQCDDGNQVEGDGCESDCTYTCEEAADCDDGHDCTVDHCQLHNHTCAHDPALDTTVCRPATDDCDAEERCNGIDPDCPPDSLMPDTHLCRPATSLCDTPEYCTGLFVECPADQVAPSTTVCRPAQDSCDATEYCTGLGPSCPADLSQPLGATCDDGSDCTLDEQCDGNGLCVGTPLGLHDIAVVSAYNNHTCALSLTGGIKCWGSNGWGCLGDGTGWPSDTPVDVVGLTSGATAVSAGNAHTCAVTDTGSALCWGQNTYGQLGDGTTFHSQTPVGVSGLSSGATAPSAGMRHTCAVTDTGGVLCWGGNAVGQLGDWTTQDSSVPVGVLGLSAGVAAVCAGGYFSCALMDIGAVKCWGNNSNGQLGDGTNTDSTIPVDIVGLAAGVSLIRCGGSHGCAVTDTGGLKCWGRNWAGELGDGTGQGSSTPVDVLGLSSGVASVSAGSRVHGSALAHTCAMASTGALTCWGSNWSGELGDGTTTDSNVPVNVFGLQAGVASVSSGGHHSCAVTTTGDVMCWGSNVVGQLGDGTHQQRLVPSDICP